MIPKKYYSKSIIYFLAVVLIIKIILLFIFPREIYFYLSGLSRWNFYNTLSFSIDMQAFRDGNHPGTPIYFIGYLILLITGNQVKDFYEYFYIHHFIILIFNFFSINIFFNYFKKYFLSVEIFSFLLIMISSFNFFIGLEIVSLISYQFGIMLILTTYFFKSLKKDKLVKLSAVCAFAISMKMTFLPFVCSILLSKCIYFLKSDFSFKKIFKLFSIFSTFFLLFNFPIIGRLPKVFLDVLFLRDDTSLSFAPEKLYSGLKASTLEVFYENQIFFFILVFFFIIFLLNIFNFFKSKNNINSKNILAISIFNLFITLFFVYTFLVAGQTEGETGLFWERENFFRNNFPYLIFIFTNYYLAKNYFNYEFCYKRTLFYISILTFGISITNFIYERNLNIKDKIERRDELTLKTKKYFDIKRDVIAYDTYSLGYGFGEEIFHLGGNSMGGNEFFTDELIDLYPNFRHLRLNTIFKQINDRNSLNKIEYKNKIQIFKDKVKKFDIILKNNLPNFLYEILSHQSKNFNFNNNIIRSNEIYTYQNNNKIRKADVILFSHAHVNKVGYIKENEIYNLIKENISVKKRVEFKVKNDTWFLYILN